MLRVSGKIASLLLLFTFLLFPLANIGLPVFGHVAGQAPFFKINGKYAGLYPVPLTSLYNFDLPQDMAPENYLVNQTINFELDKTRLPAPAEVIAKTKFIWDFGDQTKGQGLKNSHTYSRIGSYILKIYADDSTTPKPQLLESVLLNILPDLSYRLPKGRIFINGQESKDPLTDIIKADFKGDISLDGSKSTTGNRLTYYFWDFGDQQSAQGPKQNHKYSPSLSQIFVVLRIKDQNGFLADNFAEIQNEKNPSTASASATPKIQPKRPFSWPLVLGIAFPAVLLLLLAGKLFKARSG